MVLPLRTTLPWAFRWAFHTGRKKLIFNSTVVKDSSGASVLANAIPIAASAMSQRIPPCNVPMGLACCGPAAKVTVARPSAISFASNPIRRATGTSFVFARVLKSGVKGISGALMTFSPASWIPWLEHSLRGIPRDHGSQNQGPRPSAAAGLPFLEPSSFIRPAGGTILTRACLLDRIRGSFAGDQARATAEGQVFKSPLNENDDAALKLHDVNQVDEEPHQPGQRPGNVDAENVCNRGGAPDHCNLALVEIMKRRRFALIFHARGDNLAANSSTILYAVDSTDT